MHVHELYGDPSERFQQGVADALAGANDARLLRLLERCGPAEASAWLAHGLTWSDGSIGDDEADWRARTAALGDLVARPPAALAELAPTMRQLTDRPWVGNSVWLDNTTIGGALDLLMADGGYLSPATLMDLETFVRATVLYDHVFHLPNVAVDTQPVNELLSDRVFLSLPLDSEPHDEQRWHTLSAVLYSLFWQSSSWLTRRRSDRPNEDELWEAMVLGWTDVLGWAPDHAGIAIEFDAGWDSPVEQLVSSLAMASSLGPEALLTTRSRTEGDWSVYRLIAQSTSRALFNTEVARSLALPYTPNIARLPFQRHLASRQAFATRQLALADVVDSSLRHRIELLSAGGGVTPLPTFLAAVLGAGVGRNDLLAALAELRHDSASLRDHRQELQSALEDPATHLKTVDGLRKALTADARTLSDKLKVVGLGATVGTVWVSLAFASAVPAAILATLGLVRLSLDAAPIGERIHSRLRRPYEKVLTDLGRTTRDLGDAIPQLERVWGDPPFGTWADFAGGLDRIGRLRSG